MTVKRFAVLLVFVACGGKIYGSENSQQDASKPDSNDPLGGGGNLLSGKCHFTSSFKPNGGDWIYQTDADGTATATRPTKESFTTLCAGKGNEGFYYELTTQAVSTAVGTYMGMGQLNQVSNGREAEVTEWGACTIGVTSIAPMSGHDIVTGSFDCEDLKTLTGTFLMKGTFSVPLP
jgi:hypothetical protein